jgi:hypothetical protein
MMAEQDFLRLQVKDEVTFKISYSAIVDTHYKIIDERQDTNNVPVAKLDADVIPYIFPSRYCQSDKLQKLANKEFGKIENTYLKVLAINEWIYNNVEYISGSTDSGTSALDTIYERAGVCRDFAHLALHYAELYLFLRVILQAILINLIPRIFMPVLKHISVVTGSFLILPCWCH